MRGERPLTGAQAERALGSRFGTPGNELVPMGQPERIGDAFRRALRLEDYEFHGHRPTGRLTEQEIIEQAEREADVFYYLARRAGRGVDLSPTIQPVLRRWADIRAQEPQAVGREIGRFDRAKRVLDDRIATLRRAGEREMAAVLTRLKNDLLAAVDSEGHTLRDQLAAWADTVRDQIGKARPKMPDGIEDRSADVWEPLLAIADEVGGDWAERARVAAVALVVLSKEDGGGSLSHPN